MSKTLVRKLVRAQRLRGVGSIATQLLALYGVEIPPQVDIGPNFNLAHRGFGVVVTPFATIGKNVRILPGVTVGRADIHVPLAESPFERIVIEDDVILCTGCKVLGGPDVTTVGQGTIIAANAVLTESTGQWQVWAGIPAKRVSDRPRP